MPRQTSHQAALAAFKKVATLRHAIAHDVLVDDVGLYKDANAVLVSLERHLWDKVLVTMRSSE